MIRLACLTAILMCPFNAGPAFCQEEKAPLKFGNVAGTLEKVDGDQLVISVGRQREFTLTVGDDSEYLVEGVAGKLEDLKPGQPVTVGELRTAQRGVFKFVFVTNPSGINGAVVGVESEKVTVRGRQPGREGASELVITPDDRTTISLDGRASKLSELKVNTLVSVIPLTEGRRKIVAHSYGANATVVRIEGGKPVVREWSPAVRIGTNQDTMFMVNGGPGVLADLRPGMDIHTRSLPARANEPPGKVVVATARGLHGTVVKVEQDRLVLLVKPPRAEAKEVTVDTEATTEVVFIGIAAVKPSRGKRGDLKPGMGVTIFPETGTAERIFVSPIRKEPPVK